MHVHTNMRRLLGCLTLGIGMGMFSYVVPVYIAEITPKNLRGGFTAVHQDASSCPWHCSRLHRNALILAEARILDLFQRQYTQFSHCV
ncbi:Sugar/inositol transporter [Cinnamomum micranthum f. kanehirae]|uniref:Sugar/inositol transporter n=1 Tax=Cinnamomum micranthum f. kanehirae TaxID=337451 RepID=A0A443PSB9_9MAGN|nr:Sugar/inositol transporter [Cinnamomum micranthum f. kanehirae]